ncbi:hypothetical protein [Streptomyces vinaceus]|uniref:hypothetical protein n=1 Tax=Streptomyces vinaceus TaxID=1960 RepID=UPI003684A138
MLTCRICQRSIPLSEEDEDLVYRCYEQKDSEWFDTDVVCADCARASRVCERCGSTLKTDAEHLRELPTGHTVRRIRSASIRIVANRENLGSHTFVNGGRHLSMYPERGRDGRSLTLSHILCGGDEHPDSYQGGQTVPNYTLTALTEEQMAYFEAHTTAFGGETLFIRDPVALCEGDARSCTPHSGHTCDGVLGSVAGGYQAIVLLTGHRPALSAEDFLALSHEDRLAAWEETEASSPAQCLSLASSSHEVAGWLVAADVLEGTRFSRSQFAALAYVSRHASAGRLAGLRRAARSDAICAAVIAQCDSQFEKACDFFETHPDTIRERWWNFNEESRADLEHLSEGNRAWHALVRTISGITKDGG